MRSDAFAKRRRIMKMWANFCDKDQKAVTDKVVEHGAAATGRVEKKVVLKVKGDDSPAPSLTERK